MRNIIFGGLLLLLGLSVLFFGDSIREFFASISSEATPKETPMPRMSLEEASQIHEQVRKQVTGLLKQRHDLIASEHETRIAYSIMRSRGVAAESQTCRRLVERQQKLANETEKIERQLEDLKKMDDKVLQIEEVQNQAKALIPEASPNPALLEKGVIRLELSSQAGSRIPDYLYENPKGHDAIMQDDKIIYGNKK